MKIWIKLAVGIIIGVILGSLLPISEGNVDFLDSVSKLLIQIGRYVVFPLIFFSFAIGTFELRQEKKFLSVYGRLILYLILAAVILVLLGTLSVLLFSPERIPIIIEEQKVIKLPGLLESLLRIFPQNLFQVFVGSGGILLPLLVLALLLGVNLNFDLRITNPVVQLLDSLSRIFYHINSLLVELYGLAMLAIAAFFMMNLRGDELALFKQLLIILGIDLALISLAVYPGLLYLLGERQNPYKWLYAAMGPALVAFFSGDEYLSLGMLVKHGKESLGVPRRIGSAVYGLFAFFGRAGTALVVSVSFILILRSYSSLEISFLQVLWTMGYTLLVSLTLGSVPASGSFVAIATLCGIFGKGLQEGYLILKPVAPLLISFGVVLDVLTSAFVSLLIARHEDLREEIELRDFV